MLRGRRDPDYSHNCVCGFSPAQPRIICLKRRGLLIRVKFHQTQQRCATIRHRGERRAPDSSSRNGTDRPDINRHPAAQQEYLA